MLFKDGLEEEYNKEKNGLTDVDDEHKRAYVEYVFEKAEELAWRLEERIKYLSNDKTIEEIINTETEEITNGVWNDGMTGYQYGLIMRILSIYWVHGEPLRKWHNKQYGYECDGIVNPAVWHMKVVED